MVVHRAAGYEDADRWDLEFWQARTPQERLSALVDIHEDVAKVKGRRRGLRRVNRAIEEFGSPLLLEAGKPDEILQIGVAPSRVDILQKIEGVCFGTAWPKRVRSRYGKTTANWIDIGDLIRAKTRIDDPRHQEDVRVLRRVKKLRQGRS